MAKPGQPVVNRAQGLVKVQGNYCLTDTPNLLAVPNPLLRSAVARLDAAGQAQAEATVEFMLGGN